MLDEDDLKAAVRSAGIAEVVKATKIPMSTLSSWLNKPGADMRGTAKAKIVAYLKRVGDPTSTEMTIGEEKFLPIPVYDIRAHAGAGALVEDGEPVTYQVFRADELARLTRAPLSRLSLIEVTGDSMEPTIYGGDRVLVDHSIKAVDHGGFYVLQLDGANIVKRCDKDYATKAVQIISDNPRYPIQTVKSSERLQVIGRVIWIGRALR